MLVAISVERFQGFVRVNEAGEGRFVLSFPRSDAADVALFTLIRENPGQLYAERSVAMVGDWALEIYSAEIAARTGALVSTAENRMLHPPRAISLPSFADWLLVDPERAALAEDIFSRYAPAIPLPLRGVVSFKERNGR